RSAVVFVFAVAIVAVNTRAGMRDIDPNLIEMARSFGASEAQLWRRVLLPGARSAVLAGARLGLARAVSGMVAVVFLYSFFVIVANTMAGVRAGDAALTEMARSFGAGERQILFRVILPGALPLVMAGLRLGMARAMKGMINGEMFIALMGLGALVRTYGGRFDAVHVLGVLFVIVAVAVLGVGLIQALERRLTRWAS
ncbi:MAG: ABC transporter permease subunit, partial [Anaerolineales bacterium]